MPASPRTQEKDCHCKVANVIQMSEDRLAGAQVPTTRISSSFKILRLDYLPLSRRPALPCGFLPHDTVATITATSTGLTDSYPMTIHTEPFPTPVSPAPQTHSSLAFPPGLRYEFPRLATPHIQHRSVTDDPSQHSVSDRARAPHPALSLVGRIPCNSTTPPILTRVSILQGSIRRRDRNAMSHAWQQNLTSRGRFHTRMRLATIHKTLLHPVGSTAKTTIDALAWRLLYLGCLSLR
jgi:hypothetical protein